MIEGARNMDLKISNATLLNGEKTAIHIEQNTIKNIGNNIDTTGDVIQLPDNVYVSPGWIDLHTHSFPKHEPYCAHPDDIGYKTGVTTVVDAGSSGSDDIDEFFQLTKQCKTRIFSFLNISRIGLKVRDELSDLSYISYDTIEKAIDKHPDFIVGLKARMSASVVGHNNIKPLIIAKRFTKKLHIPLMVHVGNAPPQLEDVIRLLEKGDIITHCFNEKLDNHIFSNNSKNIPALKEAIRNGVYLDIGHGMDSFSFRIAKKAVKEHIPFHSISTDIYEANRVNGPVFNMATTIMKFLTLGYSLTEVIHAVTEYPAKIINKPHLGKLEKGATADLTFFQVENKETVLIDSLGNKITAPTVIKPYAVVIGGEYHVCTT